MREERAGKGGAARGPAWSGALALFALALGVRALSWPVVWTPEGVRFLGNDAYYHMRRVLYAVARFPELPVPDPYVGFPVGGQPIWSAAFDLAVAARARPVWRARGVEAVERVAAGVPARLGAATGALLFALARRHFGPGAAWVSGATLALLSAHAYYSRLGFLDHHAAVAFASTLLLGVALEAVALPECASRRRRAALAAALGLALGGLLRLWPGALLHVALAEAALGLHAATLGERRAARRFAALLAAANACALGLLLAGAGREWAAWGAWSPVVLSRFQPWLFALLALLPLAALALWRRELTGATRARRALAAAGAGAALLAASALALPGLVEGLGDAATWLLKREAFQSAVGESLPLFVDAGGAFQTGIAELRLSRLVYAFPLALGVLALRARRRPDEAARLLQLAVWAVGLALVTLLQRRFFNSFSVPFALVTALALCELRSELVAPARSRALRRLGDAALALVVLVALAPTLEAQARPLRNVALRLRGEPVVLGPRQARGAVLLRTGRWMRRGTPRTSGYWDVARAPEYGVLTLWEHGHRLRYAARRPMVVDNFGDDVVRGNFERVRRYLGAASEDAAIALLEALGVRYVVLPELRAGRSGSGAPGVAQRLFREDGTGLARHRLVFESAGPPRGEGAWFKVFEVVRGARVRGRARPGARVRAELRLTTNRGRALRYETRARADEGGRYSLTLPYATRGSPPALRTGAHYALRAGEARGRLRVPEDAVREGRALRGPDLRTGGAP